MDFSLTVWAIVLVTILSVEVQGTKLSTSKQETEVYTKFWEKGREVPYIRTPMNAEGVIKKPIRSIIRYLRSTSEVVTTLRNKIRHVRSATKLNYTLANNMETKDCPTWMYRNLTTTNDTCQCGITLNHAVSCSLTTQEIKILDSYCMTYDPSIGEVIGECLLGVAHKKLTDDSDTIHYRIPSNKSQLNHMMCGPFNRSGQLCGECEEGLSPTVYSYNFNCINCTDNQVKNWIMFTAAAFLPLTLFYLLVVLFKFNANAPHLNGFIFVSQLLSNSANIRVANLVIAKHKHLEIMLKIIASLYGIWSLDFLREVYPDICLNISTLDTLMLDYAIAFYPILLIVISYIAIKLYSRDFKPCVLLWKPFSWCASYFSKPEEKNRSMVDVFATFLLLSYTRVLMVTFDLSVFTKVHNMNGTLHGYYLYYAPTVEYFQGEHLPYAITALIIAVCINILPLCVLFFYPMKSFQKCLNYFKFKHQTLHIFADSFQGCYKDGTNGTKDCRYFAAWSFFIRFVMLGIYALTLSSYFYSIGAVVLIGNSILYTIVRPYKDKFKAYNTVDATMYLVSAMWYGSVLCIEVASSKGNGYLTLSFTLSAIISLLPLVYIAGYTIMSIHKKLRCCGVCTKKNIIALKELSGEEEKLLQCLPDRVVNPNRYHGSMNYQQKETSVKIEALSLTGHCLHNN